MFKAGFVPGVAGLPGGGVSWCEGLRSGTSGGFESQRISVSRHRAADVFPALASLFPAGLLPSPLFPTSMFTCVLLAQTPQLKVHVIPTVIILTSFPVA